MPLSSGYWIQLFYLLIKILLSGRSADMWQLQLQSAWCAVNTVKVSYLNARHFSSELTSDVLDFWSIALECFYIGLKYIMNWTLVSPSHVTDYSPGIALFSLQLKGRRKLSNVRAVPHVIPWSSRYSNFWCAEWDSGVWECKMVYSQYLVGICQRMVTNILHIGVFLFVLPALNRAIWPSQKNNLLSESWFTQTCTQLFVFVSGIVIK